MKRHAFDPSSFVFGVTFVALAMYVLLGHSLSEIPSMWAVALPALVVASLLVLYAGRRLLRPSEADPDTAAGEDSDERAL
jgi:membrane protein implicated in regulation of membrane protease activity